MGDGWDYTEWTASVDGNVLAGPFTHGITTDWESTQPFCLYSNTTVLIKVVKNADAGWEVWDKVSWKLKRDETVILEQIDWTGGDFNTTLHTQ